MILVIALDVLPDEGCPVPGNGCRGVVIPGRDFRPEDHVDKTRLHVHEVKKVKARAKCHLVCALLILQCELIGTAKIIIRNK